MKRSPSLSDFDYQLPKSRIAQRPAQPRDSARLLVYDRADKTIRDEIFSNVQNLVRSDTTFVFNNSRVEKCRLKFEAAEVFIINEVDDYSVEAMVFPGKKFKMGNVIELAEGVVATTKAVSSDGLRTIRFNTPLGGSLIEKYRQTPLPPYITPDESLADDYQTVYASQPGSRAAPTAGLHFSPLQLSRLRQKFPFAELTLHVGLGTFAQPTPRQIASKSLHQESIELDGKNATVLNRASHITAVGTTSARTLESLVAANRTFIAQKRMTDLFIQPGYRFKAIDSLITNFHLPRSSLLMLVAAMTGVDELKTIYAHALANEYRFYSFGDAMIVL